MAEFDVIIKGGMVVDGTRLPRYQAATTAIEDMLLKWAELWVGIRTSRPGDLGSRYAAFTDVGLSVTARIDEALLVAGDTVVPRLEEVQEAARALDKHTNDLIERVTNGAQAQGWDDKDPIQTEADELRKALRTRRHGLVDTARAELTS